MSDSEISFDYDDEVSLISDQESLLSSEPVEDHEAKDFYSAANAIDKPRSVKSINTLNPCKSIPLSVSWFIHDHFIVPGKRLQANFLTTVPLEELIMIMHYKKWSVDEVTSSYYEDWPRLRDAVGLSDSENLGSTELRAGETCTICCDPENVQFYSLSCGHRFCTACYRNYILASLPRGLLIRCMVPECKLSLSYSAIDALVSEAEKESLSKTPQDDVKKSTEVSEAGKKISRLALYNHLDSEDSSSEDEYDSHFKDMEEHPDSTECNEPLSHNLLLLSAARAAINSSHAKFKWCPAINCLSLVELTDDPREVTCVRPSAMGSGAPGEAAPKPSNDLANVTIVSCSQRHEFCFDCQYENHLPCPCWISTSWIKRCEDDSETVNWIDANTQSCPDCQAVIEKNGGCNHMVCGKCGNEFCWICLGDWAAHKSSYWQCNRFDPTEVEQVKKKKSDKQNSLSRYLHFYKRFAIHQVSMEGDKNTLAVVRRCMLQYMKAQRANDKRTISWNDIEFLSDAIKSLSKGRKALMWTYAFSFYLIKSNFAEIFEGMQDYLNKTVEDLSSLFEEIKVLETPERTAKKITAKKNEIVNLAASVSKRRELLIECARNGLKDGTLKFFTP